MMQAAFRPPLILRSLPVAWVVATAVAAPLVNAQTATQAAAQTADPTAASGTLPQYGTSQRATMLTRMLQAIGATPAQQSQIQAILAQARADVSALRQASGDLRRQLDQALAAPTVDATVAEGVRQKILAQQDSSSQRMLQAKLQIAAVLSPAQRQQLLALGEQRRARWQQGRHGAAAGA